MTAKFSEKLVKLRKHYKYSQQQVADLCNIDLTEYMSWENGSKLPSIYELVELSEIFKICMDDLILDSDEVELEEVHEDIEDEVITTPISEIVQEDVIIASPDETFEEPQYKFDKTQEFKVEEIKNEEKLLKEDTKKSSFASLSKKQKGLGLLGVLVLFVVAMLMIFTGGESETTKLNLIMDNTDRLIANEGSMIVLNKNGTLTSYGNEIVNTNDISLWDNLVAVSMSENHVVGLNNDGTVVASGDNTYGQLNVNDWSNIISVKAGDYHTVALSNDGQVLCTGDNRFNQCDTNDWKNIVKIEANEVSTIGLKDDGTLVVAGDIKLGELANITDICDFSINGTTIIVLLNDGSAVTNNEEYNLSWQNIEMVVSSELNIAGLLNDGTVMISGDNGYGQLDTKLFENIISIALGDGYIVGLTKANEIIMAGNDEYFSFKQEEEKEKLTSVENIQVEFTSNNVIINWDENSNATYYRINIEGIGEYTVSDCTLSIPASKFVDNQEYTIAITALSNDIKIEQSDEAIVSFIYVQIVESTTEDVTTTTTIIVSSTSTTTTQSTTDTTTTQSTTESTQSTTESSATEVAGTEASTSNSNDVNEGQGESTHE